MASGAPIISLRGVKKSFGTNEVLRGVDLDVYAGDSLVILGASGTGKSVLLRCVLGLLKPDAGEISIGGEDMAKAARGARSPARRIGMLFQGGALFDSMSIWENVAFRLIHGDGGMSRGAARSRAIDSLAQVGLGARVADLPPSSLSGGMQKRAALARAIASEPEILFFDEPTTGLDPITADVINTLIDEQVRALGATAVTITHDMVSARKIANRVVLIDNGTIAWQGSPDTLDHSGDPRVDQFVNGRADGPIRTSASV